MKDPYKTAPQSCPPFHESAGETLDFSDQQSGTVSRSRNQLLKRPRTVCLNFQRSSCNYGARCRFAQGVEDIHCKTRLCWWFVKGEGCCFGDRCHFSHGGDRKLKGNTRTAARISFAISVSRKPGDDGYCNVWEGILQEKKLCYKWMESGDCPYGLKCCFAHDRKSGNVDRSYFDVLEYNQCSCSHALHSD